VYLYQAKFQTETNCIPANVLPDGNHWYAVHAKSRHEKRVAALWMEKGICGFLPLLRQIHRWSDRQCAVEVPMFSCYAFVRAARTVEDRIKILQTPGVIGFVGSEGQGTPIPQEQIECLRAAIRENIPCYPHAYITAGRRVRICGGSLDGVEGIFERKGCDQRLVVSVELLQRSVSIQVQGYDIELI